jgi:hypothetical protein
MDAWLNQSAVCMDSGVLPEVTDELLQNTEFRTGTT